MAPLAVTARRRIRHTLPRATTLDLIMLPLTRISLTTSRPMPMGRAGGMGVIDGETASGVNTRNAHSKMKADRR